MQMIRANTAIVQQRIQEVLKLLLAGAEHHEIAKYAQDQHWEVSDRQVQRYERLAYKKLAKLSRHKQEELFGRHLLQRRGLYARALREGDIRTALQVLRDEALMQGLYPPTKVAPTTPDGRQPYAPGVPEEVIPRQERLVRLVNARVIQDKPELRRLEQSTPLELYEVPDTLIPFMALQILAQEYVSEQLGLATRYLLAERCAKNGVGLWVALAVVSAYRFHAGKVAWEQFAAALGINSDLLLQRCPTASTLAALESSIPVHGVAQVGAALSDVEEQVADVPAPEQIERAWRRALRAFVQV